MARQQASRFGTYWKHEHGRYRVEYNGTHVHGRREGFGVFFNDQGERYEGEWLNSKRHGRGRQTIGGRFDGVGADVYEGDWVMDRKTGRGVMQYANGDCYSGGWLDDEKHGEGTHFYEEKQTRYDGVWREGRRGAGRTPPWRTATCPRSFFRGSDCCDRTRWTRTRAPSA